MLRNTWWALLPAVLVAGLLCAGSAQARVYQVDDEADLIKSPETVQKINQLIKEINQRFGKEVLIEIMPTVPAADIAKVKAMDEEARRTYFSERAKRRAKEKKIDGVYILINKNPRALQIVADTDTSKHFQKNKMRDVMLAQFKAGKYGPGVLDGVEYLRGEFDASPPP
ncbi:MAG TPA: TPM domain-containing protein, partial [Gemmataceae bacterium]|nr:TPM domain-containing protein [Gemmataceae bacterium]